jgi:thiol:disulfide interchange protein
LRRSKVEVIGGDAGAILLESFSTKGQPSIMGRLYPRNLTSVVSCVSASLLLVLLASLTGAAIADDAAKPARKDSPEGIKSKHAVLTPSIEPKEAKPGDSVTFNVTATVDPGFHIYSYSEVRRPGPVSTSFDLFDKGGLELVGGWSASRDPEKHKDPNFPEVDVVEYYEGEVTWSTKLKVPSGLSPGKKTLRTQARYMVCDARICSLDGRWTLPAVELTVLPPSGAGAAGAVAAIAKSGPAITDASKSAADQKASAVAAPKADAVRSSESPAVAAPTKSAAPSSAGAGTDGPSAVQSEIAQTAQAGLIPFLIASAIGGLFALVMPCVWPMVPITVNFFIKQGQGPSGRKKATGLAFMYCLSIIAVFTAVGVLFSFFFSASSLQTLANNPWLNLLVAALFLVFGLSLLGLFELSLPSFLLNASSQNEGRGGLIGVFFMALTLTITSFTCTFPVVGGLLVMAAGGDFFYPIVGLATFATVLALPFFLLALAPGLISKMPRSGDWMNAVKVVGGLVEIGAALKFINTAELAYVVPENAWFDAEVILTCWIALAAVCGLYLLGVFRTDHDHGDVKVGTGRILFGALFLGLAIFLTPALFGRPPHSLVWDRLIIGILPPDASELATPTQFVAAGGEGSAPRTVPATSNVPAQAEKEEKKFHGVQWGMSFEQAREIAAAEKKPILIDFTGVNCANCRAMEAGVMPRPQVVSLLKKFVTVQLYTDRVPIGSLTPDQRADLAGENQVRLLKLAKEASNPIYVVLSPDGDVVARLAGLVEVPVFVDFLSKALEKFPAVSDATSKNAPRVENNAGKQPVDATANSSARTLADRQ